MGRFKIKQGDGSFKKVAWKDEVDNVAGIGRTVETVKGNADDILTLQEDKVDKVDGKGLSANDYTTTEKNKLGLIQEEANKTVISNNLTETVEGKALDATQGKVLDNKIGDLTTMPTTEKSNLAGAVSEVKNELVAHKLDYASQADVKITNLLANSDFSGGKGVWASINGTFNVNSEVGELLATSSGGRLMLVSVFYPAGIYYTSANIKSTSPNVCVLGVIGTPVIYHSGSNQWQRLSVICTIATDQTINPQFVRDNRASAYDTVYIDNIININLTAVFGSGNEPSKQEMDTLISLVPNNWWNGELKASQKLLLNWQLKMIRQNRNAIIALGGTII